MGATSFKPYWLAVGLLACTGKANPPDVKTIPPQKPVAEGDAAPQAAKGNPPMEDSEMSTVRSVESPDAPPIGGPNTLALTAVGGDAPERPPLIYGAFNISAALEGRFSLSPPDAIRLVAVSRRSGRVYMQWLADPEEIPPKYLGEKAPPSVTRVGGGVESGETIFTSGQFAVDWRQHLALPDAEDDYDVFLWFDALVSPLVSAHLPKREGDFAGSNLNERQPRIAQVEMAVGEKGLHLEPGSKWSRDIKGTVEGGRLTVVGWDLETGVAGWTVLQPEKTGPYRFSLDLARLLPGAGKKDRILVFAMRPGERSKMLEIK